MKNFAFMAFASKASTGETKFKPLIGIAPVKVLAVNPSKEELEKIYGTAQTNDPNYLGVNKETNARTARIDFILQTIPERCNGIEAISKVSFFLEKSNIVGSQSGKIQVIDKYGQNAWATKEELANHTIPQYTNGPANIDKNYWPAYVGQIQLLDFLRALMGVENARNYQNGEWVANKNLANCESVLEKIDNYFQGDFSELREIINLQPNNVVRTLWGIRDKDGKEYQTVYNEYFQKAGATTSTGFEKHVNNRKAAGAYPTTTFEFCNLREYKVTPTDMEDLPPANPADNFFN